MVAEIDKSDIDAEMAAMEAGIAAAKAELDRKRFREQEQKRQQARAAREAVEQENARAERAKDGKFLKGFTPNPKGNPMLGRVQKLRSAMLTACTDEDMASIMIKLIDMAKRGNLEAIKEVFQRTVGKPVELDLMDQIERLEQAVAAMQDKMQPAADMTIAA